MPRRSSGALTLVACIAFVLLSVLPAAAQTPSPNSPTSGELVESPKKFDGTWVTFTGEAIGEAMVRSDDAWIHINDDSYYLENIEEGAELGGYNSGQAVWLPADLARKITYFGDYKHEGDVIRVKGVFNAACGQHGGDMDIHATSLDIVEVGHEVNDPIHAWKVWLALALSAIAGILIGLIRVRDNRGEQSGR